MRQIHLFTSFLKTMPSLLIRGVDFFSPAILLFFKKIFFNKNINRPQNSLFLIAFSPQSRFKISLLIS